MRILHLHFCNLNSLVGEWEIDFTHPAYVSDGIFAITGPTGAGKTTILDALCLALYGRTPRLNKVTKSGNEVMSRQTGECFAEATFETQSGRYRCHWSQHRARRKPDGELQTPKHEIALADSGEILESSIKGVGNRIESATGMDFDRFTRSMLLAQGGFAAFLQAAPDERAPILEQITGTEIYSQISMRVHDRLREEREKLNVLQAETAGITLLEPEQEEQILQELEKKREEDANLAAGYAETGKAIAWLTAIEGLKKEMASLEEDAERLQRDIDAFQPQREKLDRSLKAAALDGLHATLTAIRKQQAQDRLALKAEQEALPALESSAREQAESLQLAERQSVHAKDAMKNAAKLLQRIRALDQRLAEQKQTHSEMEESCSRDAEKIAEDTRARNQQVEKRSEAEKSLQLLENYFQEHAGDEWLVSGLAGIEEQLRGLISRHGEIVQKETAREKAAASLEQSDKALQNCRKKSEHWKQEREAASERTRQGRDALGRMLDGRQLREYRAEKESLLREMAFLARIAELEDYRARLEDGKPCPLCGSTEHPYEEGNTPVPDDTERRIEDLTGLIARAEEQEAAIKKLEEAEYAVHQHLAEAEKQEASAAHDRMTAEKTLIESRKSVEELRADYAERKTGVLVRLLPLQITEIPDGGVSTLLESLKARLKEWQARILQKTVVEKQIAEFDSEIRRLDAVIDTQSNALAEKRERLESLKTEFAATKAERKELFGEKSPDEEELRLNKAISNAEDAERKARDRNDELRQKLSQATSRVESLNLRISQREPELKRVETEFFAALSPAGFLDEERFLDARMTAKLREELSSKAKFLDNSFTDLQARRKDRERRLTDELAKRVTDRPLEELKQLGTEQEDALKTHRDTMAGLKHKLKENTAARERLKEKQTVIEAQKIECRRWENLHELIGSENGKKYRNFAQGLTFDMMIGHANRQLQKMTDRYLLVRDDAQALELSVMDNYQAGEVRSAKNLSGGESFIVSLALALGLSQMASRNVRVDSLFLDEGFGTLDEDALDVALETLSGLQQDGKVIGVISHVPALKERIATQIQVIPRTGGRSGISGPGCGRMASRGQGS